jgi:hypothetical protein
MNLNYLVYPLFFALVSCGAKLEGPLNSAIIEQIKIDCNTQSVKLLSAEPGKKAQVKITNISLTDGNVGVEAKMIAMKCVKEKLDGMGAVYELKGDLIGTDMQQKIDGEVDRAAAEFNARFKSGKQ